MIPSRGLRWSGQAIGLGRRRLETFSTREFSSLQNTPIRFSPLLSKPSAPILRPNTKSQFSKPNVLIRNGAGIRFASTSPATIATTATTPDPAGAVSSATASTPEVTTSSLDNAIDFSSDSLYNIPEHIGYLKSLGLEYGWGPTSVMEWLLEHVHVYAGTPWWLSITITAILVRAALFKPYIDAAENSAKMHAIKHITGPLQAKMGEAFRAGDNTVAQQIRQEMQLINKRAGIKIWKSFVPMLQAVAGYGTFVLLRAMAHLPVPGFEGGGILWFSNLAIPDPFFILPMATAGTLHLVLRRGGETGATALSPEAMKLMMYGLPLLTVIFTWWLPAALQLSFFVSGLLSFGQASLFKMPAFRSYFNMQPLPQGPSGPAGPISPISPATKPPSPYKGNLKVRAPLSTAELNKAFQESRKMSLLEKAKKQVLENSPLGDISKASGSMMDKARERMERNRAKEERKANEEYEKKRQKEIKEEIEMRRQEELERRRRRKMGE